MRTAVVILSTVLFASAVMGQLPSNFFEGFGSNFPAFPAQQTQQQVPTPGNGRASTGMRPEGPILFPSSPESRDTSGVVVGASGYGFIPPGVMSIVQQARGLNAPSSFASSFSSQPFPQNYFNL